MDEFRIGSHGLLTAKAGRLRQVMREDPTMEDSTVLQAPGVSGEDRVRRSTSPAINRRIDRRTDANIRQFARKGSEQIRERIRALDREWGIERVLEFNASTLALSGLVLGVTTDRRWLWLPGIVLPFLLQHALQGWCPPLPILRRLGVRTRAEIDREKYALMALLEDRESVH